VFPTLGQTYESNSALRRTRPVIDELLLRPLLGLIVLLLCACASDQQATSIDAASLPAVTLICSRSEEVLKLVSAAYPAFKDPHPRAVTAGEKRTCQWESADQSLFIGFRGITADEYDELSSPPDSRTPPVSFALGNAATAVSIELLPNVYAVYTRCRDKAFETVTNLQPDRQDELISDLLAVACG
jgi:hypothetical protein